MWFVSPRWVTFKSNKSSYTFSTFIETPVNLALNQPTFQKDDGSWGGLASRAVDGNTAALYDMNSCTHTYSTPQPWWAVDLGQVTNIASVKITNRVGSSFVSNIKSKVMVLKQSNCSYISKTPITLCLFLYLSIWYMYCICSIVVTEVIKVKSGINLSLSLSLSLSITHFESWTD